LNSLKDGLTTSMKSVGAFFGQSTGTGNAGQPKGNDVKTHHMPPTPDWNAQVPGATTQRSEPKASYERKGGEGARSDFGDDKGKAKGKYATSYSWDNPPPRPKAEGESDEDEEKEKEKTAEELFGMDKEPSKKLLKKRAARAKEPGVLHEAVAHGDFVDARELIELGANVNEPKSADDSTTPLLVAASKGHSDIVKLLLKNGADLAALDDCGNNVLHVACAKGRADVVSRLLKAGCDALAKAGNGATALHLAARKGHDDVVELLLEHGVDIELVDSKGATALHAACSGGYEDVVALLIKKGADTGAEDGKGKTPRQIANKKGNDDCAKLIKRAIKEAEANAMAAAAMAEQRAKRAALKEAAEAAAALEAVGLHDVEVPPTSTEETTNEEPVSAPTVTEEGEPLVLDSETTPEESDEAAKAGEAETETEPAPATTGA